MTTDGTVGNGAPDVSARVMARLGYERAACGPDARRARLRRATVLALQASVILVATGLGLVWWWGRDAASRPSAPVGDPFRGSVLHGAGQIDRVMAAMPRVPATSAARPGAEPAELPSSTLENAPQLRSY